MTYCVGMRLDAGLVFLSDSRTNAGVDQVGTFRKMTVYEQAGERLMVLMTAGNLSVAQSIRELIGQEGGIWDAPNMFEAARVLGDAVRAVHERDAKALGEFGIDFNVNLLFGGQIKGERCRLFHIYSAGNFIEAHNENTYFQIGEAKYGKPILDRVLTPATSLDDAAKCALISMDSTLKSNISVGLPLDLLVYEADSLAVTRFVNIDENNQYFRMIRTSWGRQLRTVFEGLDPPEWSAAPDQTAQVLHASAPAGAPPRATPLQSVAQQFGADQQ